MLLDQIEDILSSSTQKEQDILSIFESIGSELPIIPLYLRPSAKLIRGAINWVPRQFDFVDQLSYKPARLNTHYLRASIPGKTMFYACPFTHSPTFENGVFIPRLTSLMEIRSIITEVERDGVQRVTFSRWDAVECIKLFAVPFLADYPKPCEEILHIQNQWRNTVSSEEYSEEAIELIRYLANDISTKKESSSDYMFTALFIDWFLSSHPDYSGVFYPSVQTDGEGANVALLPRTIESGIVRFVEASECWVIKRGMRSEMVMSHKLTPNHGQLVSTPYDVLQQLSSMHDPIPLEGLSFLN